ncbi:MAG: hypothetical protein C4530_03220 [Desulfobacteraceae bacterium]|nr:MAG: hypothetical protein C4530_03220 [Desulfobacteraceae bacterium]
MILYVKGGDIILVLCRFEKRFRRIEDFRYFMRMIVAVALMSEYRVPKVFVFCIVQIRACLLYMLEKPDKK